MSGCSQLKDSSTSSDILNLLPFTTDMQSSFKELDDKMSKVEEWIKNACSIFSLSETKQASDTFNQMPDPYNIMLVGSDRRDASWNGNSDVMILFSINQRKKTISIISFMRDTGVNIPDSGYGKMNYAFAKGGANLLKRTMESNFSISVNNYMAVDFAGMTSIIDLFGGIDLDITDEEIPIINSYIKEMASLWGLDADSYMLTQAGYQHINGIQAVGYMRDRYVGNNDFKRTERQRIVLNCLLENLNHMNLTDIAKLAVSASSLTWQHDFSASQISQLAIIALQCRDYSIVLDRIPYDGLYMSNGENLDPVWNETILKLHETIN